MKVKLTEEGYSKVDFTGVPNDVAKGLASGGTVEVSELILNNLKRRIGGYLEVVKDVTPNVTVTKAAKSKKNKE